MAEFRRTSAGQDALIQAGFRPSRQSGLVRLTRRLLWPFMRPFHFHTLDRVEALSLELRELRNEVAQFRSGIASLHDDLARARDENCARTVLAEVRDNAAEFRANAAHAEALTRAVLAETRDNAAEFRANAAHAEALTRAVLAETREGAAEFRAWDVPRLRAELNLLSEATPRSEDVRELVVLHNAQRAELVALSNRHVWLEGTHEVSERQRSDFEAEMRRRVSNRKLFLSSLREGVFVLKEGELISDTAAREGVWDLHILEVAERAAAFARSWREGGGAGRAVDVGGHFGLISVALARRFERVSSFEPNSFNASLLRANAALNGLSDCLEIHQAGLFSHETRISMAPSEQQEIPLPLDERGELDPLSAVNLGAYSFTENGSGLNEVPAFPLDSLSLDDVTFLKVDAQGADGEVLLGSMDTLARCRPWVVFEWEDELSRTFPISFGDVTTRLEALGYSLHVLKRHNDKQVDYLALPAAASSGLNLVPTGAASA